MKAKAIQMILIAGLALTASVVTADQSAEKPVSLRNVRLLEEKVSNTVESGKSNNWERRERRERWERREGWGRR